MAERPLYAESGIVFDMYEFTSESRVLYLTPERI